jgi:general secretion pathway protein H
MSATGECSHRNARKHAFRGGIRGFTLIEMLVILGILALIGGLLFPSMDKAVRSQTLAASASRLELALRGARADAIRTGHTVRFAATGDGRGFGVGGAIDRLAGSARVTAPDGGITFYADGSTNGGRVTLTDGRFVRRLDVRAPTGAVEKQP